MMPFDLILKAQYTGDIKEKTVTAIKEYGSRVYNYTICPSCMDSP
jgi:hypothetical protein